jgi:hypothetical protein
MLMSKLLSAPPPSSWSKGLLGVLNDKSNPLLLSGLLP